MALLAGMCCQAAGGKAEWADRVAAAWILFYTAADIMDSVQDQDEPDSWWADIGPAAALSAATGLFFSASSVLYQISEDEFTRKQAPVVIHDFINCLMNMSSGQFTDLRIQEPSLEQYWETASRKSGAFFSLACRSGALLATVDKETLDHYNLFGEHLGLLIQILDDLEDIQFLSQPTSPNRLDKLTRSLPIVYATEMYPPNKSEELKTHLRRALDDHQSAIKAVQLIEDSGAVIFILAEIERYRKIASEHLIAAEALSPAREILLSYLDLPTLTY